jgi:prepilin-type processing-associated H-X9-DG protein
VTTNFLTGEGSFHLVFGWIEFLFRTLPRIKMDWISVGFSCVAFVVLAGCVHFIGRGFGRSSGGAWKLRWSIVGTALVALMFAAGVASVGAIHQVGWMATSPEPTLVPVVQLGKGVESKSALNLRRLGGDFASYPGYGDQLRILPKGGTFSDDGRMLHSWSSQLAQFQGIEGYMFTRRPIDFTKPWNDPANQDIFKDFHPLLLNPELRGAPIRDADGYALSHYAANSRVMGGNFAATYAEMGRCRWRTILVGEVNSNFKPWGHPCNWRDPGKGINRSPDGFGGAPGSGGAHFLMADGSVVFISDRTGLDVLRALASPKEADKGDVEKLDAAMKIVIPAGY